MSLAAVTSLINTVTTDAAFRTWGLAYNAKFAAAGWVQTADTGQINWTTVLAATAINTVKGYEIWRFDDALQSTAPVFILVEYGSGAAVADGSFWITLGSGSNGAGSLTGIQSIRQQITTGSTVAAINHYWSGSTNRFGVAASGAGISFSSFFSIERTVDSAGVVTSEGCLMIMKGVGAAWKQLAWNQITGSYTTWETTIGAMGAGVAPFGTFGSQVAIYPIFHNKGVFLIPGLNAYVYENSVIAAGSPISFTTYGATHTYMPLGSTAFGSVGRGGFSVPALMMRYE